MAHYNLKDAPVTTAEEHEAVARAFCEKLFSDPDITRKLLASNVVARFVYFDDENWGKGVTVELTIDCRGDAIEISTGESDIKADFEIVESRITGHIYWMGKLNFMSAITRGLIKVNGSVRMAMKLLPVVKPGFVYYRETLKEMGYDDLLAFPPE
ncbi:MAG: hypothetical protein ACYC99_13755 [Candidatus Geothermincolia bacterium]